MVFGHIGMYFFDGPLRTLIYTGGIYIKLENFFALLDIIMFSI